MDTPTLLALARETIAKVPLCFVVTAAANGEANARIVQPGPLREDWSVGFMTSRLCRKFDEIQRAGRFTMAYQHDPDRAYVTLAGRAVVIDDIAIKQAVWRPDSDHWHPGGPQDPNVVIIKLVTDRIEFYSGARDVVPQPRGLSAAVLLREGAGWRYAETSPPAAGP